MTQSLLPPRTGGYGLPVAIRCQAVDGAIRKLPPSGDRWLRSGDRWLPATRSHPLPSGGRRYRENFHRLATGGYGLATGGYGLATGGYPLLSVPYSSSRTLTTRGCPKPWHLWELLVALAEGHIRFVSLKISACASDRPLGKSRIRFHRTLGPSNARVHKR